MSTTAGGNIKTMRSSKSGRSGGSIHQQINSKNSLGKVASHNKSISAVGVGNFLSKKGNLICNKIKISEFGICCSS